MEIIKSTGERQQFDKEKFCGSIRKAGAPADLADRVCNLASKKLPAGTTTAKIFRSALNYLVKEDIGLAASYGLRRALDEFGPAGFLFEQYVEVILQAYGYKTERDIILQGSCVEHEIDVSARDDGNHYLIEAKYRNEQGIKTHIDVVMYADARLMDIVKYEENIKKENSAHKLWLFTNTKFTEKAIRYAKCRNIKMTGWNYPEKEDLQSLILKKKLYPITVLPSLNKFAREQFAKRGAVLAQDLLPYTAEDLGREFRISLPDAKKISAEAQKLVKP